MSVKPNVSYTENSNTFSDNSFLKSLNLSIENPVLNSTKIFESLDIVTSDNFKSVDVNEKVTCTPTSASINKSSSSVIQNLTPFSSLGSMSIKPAEKTLEQLHQEISETRRLLPDLSVPNHSTYFGTFPHGEHTPINLVEPKIISTLISNPRATKRIVASKVSLKQQLHIKEEKQSYSSQTKRKPISKKVVTDNKANLKEDSPQLSTRQHTRSYTIAIGRSSNENESTVLKEAESVVPDKVDSVVAFPSSKAENFLQKKKRSFQWRLPGEEISIKVKPDHNVIMEAKSVTRGARGGSAFPGVFPFGKIYSPQTVVPAKLPSSLYASIGNDEQVTEKLIAPQESYAPLPKHSGYIIDCTIYHFYYFAVLSLESLYENAYVLSELCNNEKSYLTSSERGRFSFPDEAVL